MLSHEAMRDVFKAKPGRTSNQPHGTEYFPDYPGPVVRLDQDGERVLEVMRWGFPPAKAGLSVVTNVRNTDSPFWRGWLKPEFRCLVPVSEFLEWTDSKPKEQRWFALDDKRTPFAFAGIWRPWSGTRGTKKDPVEGEHLLYSFLTTEANAVVKPVHAKAMPVCLTSAADVETWLHAPWPEARALQKSAPDDALKIVDPRN